MDVDTSPLKRCSSAPVIPNSTPQNISQTSQSNNNNNTTGASTHAYRTKTNVEDTMATPAPIGAMNSETPPAPNIFSRTRRYSSGSFSPLVGIPSPSGQTASPSPATSAGASTGPRLTPRVSQLRKEECADIANTREVSHERGLHSALQISQSWEDLTIVTESWSCRDDLSTAPIIGNCSSPSPTSSRHPNHLVQPHAANNNTTTTSTTTSSLRYPFGMSPSPTRKTFATRRSMSPNHVRPSQLCPVKRKFDMDDSCGGGSPPPHKKMFLDMVARGSSPSHSMCASPDSGTYEGRTTPKLFISKLCSSNSLSSFSSASASPTSQLDGMGEGGTPIGSSGGGGGAAETSCAKGALSSSSSSNTNSNSSTTTMENNNNNNNSSSSSEEAKDKSDAEGGGGGDAKQQMGVNEEEDDILDHPMLDVSKEPLGDNKNREKKDNMNCDSVGGVGLAIRDETKLLLVDSNMAGGPRALQQVEEVDDGIGIEDVGLSSATETCE